MPSVKYGSGNVAKDLTNYYDNTADMIYELSKAYAARALAYFREHQTRVEKNVLGEFWTNRTRKAATLWFARAYRTPTAIGFYASHSDRVPYAEDLEYGHNRRFESLRPIMKMFTPPFLKDVKYILEHS